MGCARPNWPLILAPRFSFASVEAGVLIPPPQTPSDLSVSSIVLTMKRRPVTAAVVAGIVFLSALSASFMVRQEEPLDEAELARQLAVDMVRYSAALRQTPARLGDELATGELEQGDAVSSESRLEDYYYYETTDSTAFHLVLTSAAFPPDIVVVTPDGRRLAASALMQTDHRAETVALLGAGRYEITVTTREPGQGGPYELSAGLPIPPIVLNVRNPTHEDTLGVSAVLRAGRYEHRYLVEARPDEPVILSVYAQDFTPKVRLLGPEGEVTEPWSSVEKHMDEDSNHVTVLRFRPGSEAPYLVLATSEERAAQGPYIMALETARVLAISTDGRRVSAKLGEHSWYKDNRYLDSYEFQARANDKVVIEVRSEEFAPRLVLRRGDRNVTAAEGAQVARTEQTLSAAGAYDLDVTSMEADKSGAYTVSVTIERPEAEADPAQGGSRTYTASASRTGATNRGHQFEVSVSSVTVTNVPGGRVRIQVSIRERSVDFEGEWDPWERRARHSWITDNTGRRFEGAPAEARGGDGATVTPGGARSGRLSYYGAMGEEAPSSITLHFPIGSDRGVVVSVPITLQR